MKDDVDNKAPVVRSFTISGGIAFGGDRYRYYHHHHLQQIPFQVRASFAAFQVRHSGSSDRDADDTETVALFDLPR
jgi:hypothetical protein